MLEAGAGGGGFASVVRSGTSLRSHESPNGMTAIAIPQRKTPWSEWAKAWRKSAWTVGRQVLRLLRVEVDAAAEVRR